LMMSESRLNLIKFIILLLYFIFIFIIFVLLLPVSPGYLLNYIIVYYNTRATTKTASFKGF